MKLTFLGTGAATGVPLPFCRCAVCCSARANGGHNVRLRASLLIDDNLLIDLGPDAPGAMLRFGCDLTRVRHILQTHAHADHFDAGHFITRDPAYATAAPSPIDLVCSPETAAALNFKLKLEDDQADLFSPDWRDRCRVTLHLLRHGDMIALGGYAVTAIESMHGENGMIYRIAQGETAVLYATDLDHLTARAWKELRRLPVSAAILDCTYGAGINGDGHLNANQVTTIAHRMRQDGILRPHAPVYATHISHEGSAPHDEMEKQANGYHIAYDGLTIEL